MNSIQRTADIKFIQRLTQKFEKRFLVIAVDGLQNTARLTFRALRGLPHNRLEAVLHEASKTGIGKIQDRLIKSSGGTEDATQDFLRQFLRNGSRRRQQGTKSIAHHSAMVIQCPICGGKVSEHGHNAHVMRKSKQTCCCLGSSDGVVESDRKLFCNVLARRP